MPLCESLGDAVLDSPTLATWPFEQPMMTLLPRVLNFNLPDHFSVLLTPRYDPTVAQHRMSEFDLFTSLLINSLPDLKHSQALRNGEKQARIRQQPPGTDPSPELKSIRVRTVCSLWSEEPLRSERLGVWIRRLIREELLDDRKEDRSLEDAVDTEIILLINHVRRAQRRERLSA